MACTYNVYGMCIQRVHSNVHTTYGPRFLIHIYSVGCYATPLPTELRSIVVEASLDGLTGYAGVGGGLVCLGDINVQRMMRDWVSLEVVPEVSGL